MSHHLNDHDLALAAAGTPLDQERAAHLEACVSCRRSVNRFLERVEARRLAMEEEAPDWGRQLERVLEGLPGPQTVALSTRRRWVRPFLAAAATITLAVGAGLIVHENRPDPSPKPRPEIAIEEILAQTDSLLAEESIPDFTVLDTLTDEDLPALFETLNS